MSKTPMPSKRSHPLVFAYRVLGRYAPHYLASLLCEYASYATFGVGLAWGIRVFTEGVSSGNRQTIVLAVWIMLANAFIMASSVVAGLYFNFLSTEKVAQDLRVKLVRRALRAPIPYLDSHPVSETLTNLLNDVDTAKDVLGELAEISGKAFLAVSATVTMLTWGWQIALILLAAGSACAMLGLVFAGPLKRVSREYQDHRAKVTGLAVNVFSGITVLKSLAAERIMSAKFKVISGEQEELGKRQSTVSLLANTVPNTVSEASGVGVLLAVGWLVLKGRLDLALGIGLWQLAEQAIPAFINAPTRWVGLQPSIVAWERLRGALEMSQEAQFGAEGGANGGMPSCESVPGADFRQIPDIQFDSVTFSYRPDTPVLCETSFFADHAQKVALVGPSGTGKTTLFKLLLRMYQPSAGTIRVRGRNVASMSLRELRGQMALVPQEPWIFPGTVADNIRLGSPEASNDQVIKAAAMANAHEFVSAMSNGYETLLTERGGNISLGERQRICLARAFLRDTPILLLDEPTSSVDAGSERVIKEVVDRLAEGRTVITISHTGTMSADCDAAFTLNDGRVQTALVRAGGRRQSGGCRR